MELCLYTIVIYFYQKKIETTTIIIAMTTFIHHFWMITSELAPWLLLGAAVAGILHVFIPRTFVRNHLGRGGLSDVVRAVLFGVPMPLCSCGVIPAAIGLHKHGASKGASTGFLISTPQTGVDSIAVSGAFLGWPFAIFKVLAAFIMGIVGGVTVNWTDPDGNNGKTDVGEEDSETPPSAPPRTVQEFCDFTVDELLASIWKWLLVGIVVSALISTFVGRGELADAAWAQGFSGMIVMLLIALPLYVCATGSVPIAASLVAGGMPTGAALVFLMAGPATNIATLGAVFSTFGRHVTAIYIAVVALGSILLGWAFDALFGNTIVTAFEEGHAMNPIGAVAAIFLLLLMIRFAYRDLRELLPTASNDQEEQAHLCIEISGMTCQGCANRVRNALMKLEGVQNIEINLETGTAVVVGQNLDQDTLATAIREAGYTPGAEG
jgi:uncharacterized membrane protein YraQ (UPF0718 family)/copper chaperone CopZ